MWEHWLPDFQWYLVRGGLCSNEEFEKAVAEIQDDTYHDEPVLYGLRCSSRASLGGTTRAAARPLAGRLLRRRGPRARDEAHDDAAHLPPPDRCELVLRRACKQRHRLTSSPTRQAASAGDAPRPTGAVKRKVSPSRSSSLSGRVGSGHRRSRTQHRLRAAWYKALHDLPPSLPPSSSISPSLPSLPPSPCPPPFLCSGLSWPAGTGAGGAGRTDGAGRGCAPCAAAVAPGWH